MPEERAESEPLCTNGQLQHQKSDKDIWWPIRRMIYTFSINGQESVKHSKFKENDFSLPKDTHVANYDEPALIEFWNSDNAYQTLLKRICSSFTDGILWRTTPILFIYLLSFFVFNMLVLAPLCDPSFNQNSEENLFLRWMAGIMFSNYREDVQLNRTSNGLCNDFDDSFEEWREKEHAFTRILTFLLGFYVSYTMRNWWVQVALLPRMDTLCIAIGSFISTKSQQKEDQLLVKKGLTVKMYKMTIVRLFLLSWTMCLSRFSPKLKRSFKNAKIYNVKRLLTKREYDELKFNSGCDGWIEKWCTPLLWVNKLVSEIGMKGFEPIDKESISIKDPKELSIAIYKFQSDLQKISNHHFYKTPSIITQAISAALYFFLLLGVIAAQGAVNNSMSFQERLIFHLPLYQCMKYLLLFGWLKTAKDLQNPFGHDRLVHVCKGIILHL